MMPRLLILLILIACPVATAQPQDTPFVGKATTEYQQGVPKPLRMPTDVAVGADGRLFIADGVNDRVVVFDGAGKFIESIEQVGNNRLSRPVGVAMGPSGALWIADTGNGRVVQRNADGSLGTVLSPTPASNETSIDITDVVIDAGGRNAWLIDNDHHRLLRIDLASQAQTVVGRYGESVGQLNYPLTLVFDERGDAYVLESINARISIFSSDGAPRRTISRYGIELGELYRPTGIAIDQEGLLWVADATMGAIQIFRTDGRLLDTLRNADGSVMRFDHCMGIAFDSNGHLYVTELQADRVRKVEITRGAEPAPVRAPQASGRPQLVGRRARSCTICHIEWFESYTDTSGQTLVEPLPEMANDPIVSRSKMCLSCHDGSVGDSRARVWQDHGHRTDIAPPSDMKVPDALPLVNGTIKCRTCHSAHTSGQFNADFAKAIFLRTDQSVGSLCISCHTPSHAGMEHGSHPMGSMKIEVPVELVNAGARVERDATQITCVVCHTSHGSPYDNLMVLPASENTLCTSCHAALAPESFAAGMHASHPLTPSLNPQHQQAVANLGMRLGADEQLICLSCHDMHHAKGKQHLLPLDMANGALCLGCHTDMQSVTQTTHDLRRSRPEVANRAGVTPTSGGPCSSCHMFHQAARTPETFAFDKAGQCITCHQADRCASNKLLGERNHPGESCLDCHDPHTNAFDHFMRGQPAEVCSNCHADQAQLVGGGHDAARQRSAWPEVAAMTEDRCLACHRPHSTSKQRGMRVEPCGRSGPMGDDVCIACHTDADWDATSHVAMMHPRNVSVQQVSHGLPTARAGTSETLGCRTCHNPHAPPSRAGSLLRVDANATATSLCFKCHTDMSGVAYTGHGAEALTHAGLDADSCLPCHSVHANPALVDERLMAPRAWWATTTVNDPTTMSGDDARCTGCHRSGGSAAPARIATHPVVPMRQVNRPDSAAFLPLFDAQGERSETGAITCRTCHAPHGQIPADGPQKLAGLTDAERRAQRLMLRPFNAPNVCSTCHGMDALRRFLYFHDSDKRGGSLASRRLGNNGTAP